MRNGRIVKLLPILLVLLSGALAACNGGVVDQPATVITEELNIDRVAIIAIGQTPVKIHANVEGTFPNDCTLIFKTDQGWIEDVYEIRILTKRPVNDSECEEGPVAYEEIYEIPVFKLAAGEYTIDVNGVREPLVFVFDNE